MGTHTLYLLSSSLLLTEIQPTLDRSVLPPSSKPNRPTSNFREDPNSSIPSTSEFIVPEVESRLRSSSSNGSPWEGWRTDLRSKAINGVWDWRRRSKAVKGLVWVMLLWRNVLKDLLFNGFHVKGRGTWVVVIGWSVGESKSSEVDWTTLCRGPMCSSRNYQNAIITLFP